MAESREGYTPPEYGSPEQKDESTQESKETGNESADLDQAAEDITDELNLEKESAAPPSAETRRTVTKKISEAIKHYWHHTGVGAVAGFATVSAARIAIKQSVLLSLGGSLGMGAIAGGVAGAAIEGVRAYIKERTKFSAQDIVEQLNGAQSPKEKAAIVARAEAALKEARISKPDEVSGLVDAVRAARLHVETELEKDTLQGKSEAQQISWLLKSAGRNLKEVPRSEKKNAKALLKNIEFKREKSTVDRAKVVKAMVKGALAGALGGAIGGALSHYVLDNLHPGQWMEKAIEPIMESNPGIGQEQAEAMAEEALRQKTEAAAAAAARVLEEGKQQLLQENFTGVAERGDGWTHLARKAVHDYLVNLRELSPESAQDLNMEQLVHIEDTIVKEKLKSGASELIHPGQKLELQGEHIQSLIAKAQGLSPEKIQNISQVLAKPEHYLSPATIAAMTDYQEVINADNDLARVVSSRAKEAAQAAAAAVSEIIIPEAASQTAPAEEDPAAEADKSASQYAKTILAILAGGAVAGYAAKRVFGEKSTEAKKPKAEKPVIQKPVPKAPAAPAPAEVRPVPAPEEKTEEDKTSPPQESKVSTAVAAAAGALAGATAVEARASAEKKGAPATPPIAAPHEVHPVPISKIETPEDEPQTEKSVLISKELKEISDKWGVPIEIEDPIYLRSDRRRKAIFEKLASVADRLNQEDMNLLKKNAPKGILFSKRTLFDRNQQRIEISYGEYDDYILEHIKRSASDEEQEKLAEADAEFLVFKKKLETSYSLSIDESEDMMGHSADRRKKMIGYIDRIISLLNKREIDDLKIIAPNGIEIKTYGAHFNEIKKTISIGKSLPPRAKDKLKSEEQITIIEIREIIKKQLAAKKSEASMPAVNDKTSANQENMEHAGEREPNEELISKLGELNQKYEPYGIVIDADPSLSGMARLAAFDELEAVLDGLDLDKFKEYFPGGILLTSQNQRGLGGAISFDFRQTGDELSAFVNEAMNEARAQAVAEPKKTPSTPVIPTTVEPSAPAEPKPAAQSVPAAPKPTVPAAPTAPKIPAEPAAAPLTTPEAAPVAETAPKLEKRDWWEVKRETEVMAVEDLGGDMRLFEKHVATLGVAEKDSHGEWKWTGGDKKLVFLGDILGDRDMDGMEITSIIGDIAEQAEKEGGQVDILCGNHEEEFIDFLTEARSADLVKIDADHYSGQAIGIWELAQFDPDPNSELKKIGPKTKSGPEKGSMSQEFKQREEELWVKLYQRIPAILENMRTDPKGKEILDAICQIKIAVVHDDTLFFHTDPTRRMVEDITKNGDISQRVLEVNKIFQENLRGVLFQGEKLSQEFIEIEKIYTHADNREYFTEQENQENFKQFTSDLLQRTYDRLENAGKIDIDPQKMGVVNFRVSIVALDNMLSIDIDRSIVEECIGEWKKEKGIKGDYTSEVIEVLNALKPKNENQVWQARDKLTKKVIDLNPEKIMVPMVPRVRSLGINAIMHGHSPVLRDRYYDENGFIIASPHTRYPRRSDSESERAGVSTIHKNGKIDLIGKHFREQIPSPGKQ